MCMVIVSSYDNRLACTLLAAKRFELATKFSQLLWAGTVCLKITDKNQAVFTV